MLIYENRASKMKFFWCQGNFRKNFDLKMGEEMNLRIKTRNRAADPEKGFSQN